MDEIDKKILNLLQTDFPVEEEPFRRIGEQVGISEDEVLQRVQTLKDEKIIRRIGAVFDLRRLGYVSTLCAARVPEKDIDAVARVVNDCPEVTHNYVRSHEYNVWFTVIAPSEEALQETIDRIKAKTGIDEILDLRATKTFKINASFEV